MANQKLASVKPPAKGAKPPARTAAPEAEAEVAAPPPRPAGRKRLFILAGVMALALALAGARAAGLFTSLEEMIAGEPVAGESAAGEPAAGAPAAEKPAAAKKAAKTTQLFVPIDNFTVNLLDADRYLQLGLVIEVSDAHVDGAIKQKMPVIRSSILLALSAKRADEIASPEGKRQLAEELLKLVRAPLGAEPAAQAVEKVHFSAFIIQ